MDLLIFYTLEYNIILFSYTVLDLAIRNTFCGLLYLFDISLSLSCNFLNTFLLYGTIRCPTLPRIVPTQALESAISPRDLCTVGWSMVSKTKTWGLSILITVSRLLPLGPFS